MNQLATSVIMFHASCGWYGAHGHYVLMSKVTL